MKKSLLFYVLALCGIASAQFPGPPAAYPRVAADTLSDTALMLVQLPPYGSGVPSKLRSINKAQLSSWAGGCPEGGDCTFGNITADTGTFDVVNANTIFANDTATNVRDTAVQVLLDGYPAEFSTLSASGLASINQFSGGAKTFAGITTFNTTSNSHAIGVYGGSGFTRATGSGIEVFGNDLQEGRINYFLGKNGLAAHSFYDTSGTVRTMFDANGNALFSAPVTVASSLSVNNGTITSYNPNATGYDENLRLRHFGQFSSIAMGCRASQVNGPCLWNAVTDNTAGVGRYQLRDSSGNTRFQMNQAGAPTFSFLEEAISSDVGLVFRTANGTLTTNTAEAPIRGDHTFTGDMDFTANVVMGRQSGSGDPILVVDDAKATVSTISDMNVGGAISLFYGADSAFIRYASGGPSAGEIRFNVGDTSVARFVSDPGVARTTFLTPNIYTGGIQAEEIRATSYAGLVVQTIQTMTASGQTVSAGTTIVQSSGSLANGSNQLILPCSGPARFVWVTDVARVGDTKTIDINTNSVCQLNGNTETSVLIDAAGSAAQLLWNGSVWTTVNEY